MNKQLEVALAKEEITIIGAGFGRTGTVSIKAALEELGFGPCYHMSEVLDHPERARQWNAAARGETVNWKEMFKGYRTTVDWPGSAFYKELLKIYPDAKVLLTVRDPESWYESIESTLYQMRNKGRSPFVRLLLRAFFPNMYQIVLMVNAIIWNGTFNGNFTDKKHAIGVFNQHIEEVKRYVPPEQLLVYNVKEGWQPLCAFLGVEVPKDKPFPRLNDRSSFIGDKTLQRSRTAIARGVLIMALIIIIAILWLILLH